MEVIDEIA